MAREVNYIEGVKVFKPNENAPDFIIASGNIDVDKFTEWAKNQPSNIIKYQIKRARETGYYYIEVDTYTKQS